MAWAVRDVAFAVYPGETFGLVGPDGAGKSTLLRLLCGNLLPTAGDALVLGHSVARSGRRLARQVGYLSQGLGLYHDLTVVENLRFCAALHGILQPSERIAALLRLTGLFGHEWKQAGALSGGMRQKLGLACSLIHQPPLVLLDEPTTGVDPVSRREFWSIVVDLGRQGTSFLVSTPYMDEAERCHRVAFLSGGRLLATGAPADLRRAFPGPVFAANVPGGRALQAARSLAGHRVRVAGNSLRIYGQPGTTSRSIQTALDQAGIGPVAVHTVEPALEDTFVHLIQGADHELGG